MPKTGKSKKNNLTITDIALHTKYSISTVSKALSNSSDIGESTKNAILKYAIQSGYCLNNKKDKSKGKIAIITEGIDYMDSNRFQYQMFFGFQLAASTAGYETVIIQKPADDFLWSFSQTVENIYQGVFLLRLNYYAGILKEIAETATPTIMFDQAVDNRKVAYIGCDNEAGINYAVRHLAEQGHQKIAFYGGTPTALVSVARKAEFIRSLRELGLEVFPEVIFESNFCENHAHAIVPKIAEFGATAIICASDLLAKYAIDELTSMKISVPRDISVIGYDNVPFAEEMTPKLTTINQSSVELGKISFNVLQSLIDGIPISKLLFRPSLIVRDSTAPPVSVISNKEQNSR